MDACVYLAGKISKNGWRQSVVDDLRSAATSTEDIIFDRKNVATLIDGLFTSGPFFVSCDHGCYHGEETHGVGVCGGGCCGGGLSPYNVTDICMEQIKRSDFIFAFINQADCYGTLCEIGYAKSLQKPIVILFANDKLREKMWFAAELANVVYVSHKDEKKAPIDPIIDYYAAKIVCLLKNKGEV